MPNFEFTNVQRGKLGTSLDFPDDVVRLYKRTLSFNGSISKQFNSTRYTTKAGVARVKLALAYDRYNQAIQIKADPEGFGANIGSEGLCNLVLPSAFRKLDLPIGDYKLVRGETNVFQLARD